jgi:chorismate mutase
MTIDLRIRQKEGAEEFNKKLNVLRSKIDIIDNQIVDFLGKRMSVADDIGELKKENNVAILQPERWNSVLNRLTEEGEKNHLSKDFVERLTKAIHEESIAHQHKIISQ